MYKVFTGSNQSPLFDLHCYYRVKSVSLVRCTRFLQGQTISLFLFTRFLQGQICLPFSIYNVITRSNRSLVFDLQGFYRVKSVSLLRFTRFLQGQISLPFLIFDIFTMLNDSIPFRFTGFLQNNCNVAVNYPV